MLLWQNEYFRFMTQNVCLRQESKEDKGGGGVAHAEKDFSLRRCFLASSQSCQGGGWLLVGDYHKCLE